MWRVVHHDNGTDINLCAWFVSEATARDYAEALKDSAQSYSLFYVPKDSLWECGWSVVEV